MTDDRRDYASLLKELRREVPKQRWFEQKIVKTFLQSMETYTGQAAAIVGALGEDVTIARLMEVLPDLPVKLGTYKLKELSFAKVVKNPKKTPLLRAIEDLQASYPDECVGLVFAAEGDGMPDLIIHSFHIIGSGALPDKGWRVSTKPDERHMFIEPFSVFLISLSGFWNLNPDEA